MRWRLQSVGCVLAGLAVLGPATAGAAAPVSITFLAHAGYQRAFDPLVKAFNETHPDIQVTAVYGSSDANTREKFLTMATGGVTPDVLWHFEAALFASRGLVTSVEPFLNRLSQREQLLRDFVPGSLGRYTYQGRLYALPFGVNTSFMVIYNPSLMARSGVTPPREGWNWADFLVLARKLTLDSNGDGQVDQWGFDSNRGYWLPWLINSRGRMFDRDTQTWFPDKAANREAFRFAVSLLREHQVMAPTAQGYGGLARQATVMFGDGNYAVSWMRTNDVSFPLQVVHWPVNGSRAIFVGGYGLFLGATSDRQRQEAAWTFISWLLEPAQQMKYVQVTGQIPSRLSAIRNAEYASQMSREPALAAFVNEVATYGVGQPIPVGYGDVLQMMFRWADRAYRGEVSPDAALEGLYDEINAYYKEVRVPLL